MEGRVRGLAAVALALILVITAGWWALALYPVGAGAPDWVLRTRAACFGSVGSGLPTAGGWVLLVGEPIGMGVTLAVVWGDALASDLRWLVRRAWGRALVIASGLACTLGLLAATHRVAGATIRVERVGREDAQVPLPLLDGPSPPLALTDQHGNAFTLDAWRGRAVLVTFAFAHCEDVCPTVVRQLRDARRAARREQVPLVVVTLDPWRDVPERLPHMARQWELGEGDRMLGGSVDAVNGVLDAWGVGRSRNAQTGEIVHAAVAFLIDARGRVVARLDGGTERMRGVLEALDAPAAH